MGIVFEKYVGDVDQYISLQNNSHIPNRDQWVIDTKKSIDLNIKNNSSLFLGIPYGLFLDGELIGACKLLNFYSNKRWIEVFDIVISPDFRGKNLGAKMVSLLIQEIKYEYNREMLVLSTGDAKPFYEKIGMSCFGELKGRSFMCKEII